MGIGPVNPQAVAMAQALRQGSPGGVNPPATNTSFMGTSQLPVYSPTTVMSPEDAEMRDNSNNAAGVSRAAISSMPYTGPYGAIVAAAAAADSMTGGHIIGAPTTSLNNLASGKPFAELGDLNWHGDLSGFNSLFGRGGLFG